MIYHITTRAEVERARASGEYEPDGFAREGFVHCSYRHQLAGVADRYFRGRSDLVLLEIDPAKLSCRVVDENLAGGAELFPHVYGKVPMPAVVSMVPFPTPQSG